MHPFLLELELLMDHTVMEALAVMLENRVCVGSSQHGGQKVRRWWVEQIFTRTRMF
jgi:hypothetical protein